MKKFIVDNPVFKREVLVMTDCSRKEANKYLLSLGNKLFFEESDDAIGGLCVGQEGVFNLMHLNTLSKDIDSMGCLVHEIAHLVVRLCEDKGVSVISNIQNGGVGDEVFAYLSEFYFNEIMNKAFPKKNKNSKKNNN